ncbi:unnamed protein product [Lathyrus sativus]|nr:unnamed protein product [Lathyrus sativus]
MSNEIDALWKRFRSIDVAGKKTIKIRTCEIAYPTTTRMCSPPEKIKTKGGVKTKGNKPVGYDVYCDPPYHEYVDQENSSSQKYSNRSCSQLSQISKKKPSDRFIVQFLDHIRPFIDDTVDIKSDGNSGFRVIAS